jgi:hypothetical protein
MLIFIPSLYCLYKPINNQSKADRYLSFQQNVNLNIHSELSTIIHWTEEIATKKGVDMCVCVYVSEYINRYARPLYRCDLNATPELPHQYAAEM